ncbi:MAG: hypothetical protein JW750_09550 [Anaerolineaceae bacterium]|nr:hypothetical protein [Anaerolineaceae bacterium]
MEDQMEWYWCQHCSKAYRDDGNGSCPYCGAITAFDGWRWEKLRKFHPDLPEMPIDGKEYRVMMD